MSDIQVLFNPGVHPQFKEIFAFPPNGVKYIYNDPKGDHNSNLTRRKRWFLSQLHNTGLPRMARIKNSPDFDLMYSTRGILPITKKPWIIDLESGAAFASLNWKKLKNPLMQKIIKKFLSSKNCKKIMPQCNAAKKSLLENVDCSKFEDKIETLYLAYHSTKLQRKDSDTVRLSFIGRGFYEKGGNDVQEAFKILNKKYKISLKYKGIVPEDKKLNLPNVEYLENIPDPSKFYDVIFGDCDIYVQPTTVDSFGVSILEAMSTGLPIICTDDFALPELVENGKNGFLVKSEAHWYDHRYNLVDEYPKLAMNEHPQTVKELVEKISILIEDVKLRKKMGKVSFDLVDSGKFSIEERNRKLLKIFKESLN